MPEDQARTPCPCAEVKVLGERVNSLARDIDLINKSITAIPGEVSLRSEKIAELFEAKLQFLHLQTEALSKIIEEQPKFIKSQIVDFKLLIEERFHLIDVRFQERDLRFAQSASDHQRAIDAEIGRASCRERV